MLRFACPACNTVMTAPADKVGRKATCLKCGQRLQIPAPPRPTMLATPLPVPSTTAPPRNQVLPVRQSVGGIALPQTQPVSNRTKRRVLWLLFVVLALCLGAGWMAYRASLPLVGQVAEVRSMPQTEAEELVRKYILNNSLHPQSVKFLKWGPHLTWAEWVALLKEGGAIPQDGNTPVENVKKFLVLLGVGQAPDFDAIIRVRYKEIHPFFGERGSENVEEYVTHDDRFTVQGKIVFAPAFPMPVRDEKSGDEWKKDLRHNLARQFPSLDPGPPSAAQSAQEDERRQAAEAEKRRREMAALAQTEKESRERQLVEQRLQKLLRFVKKLRSEGRNEQAKQELEEIVRENPGTEGAKDAKRLLEEMARQ
jgi:hypothetical protein